MTDNVTLKFQKTIQLLKEKSEQHSYDIKRISLTLKQCIRNRGKILICGNGGSASQANHIATELVVRMNINRKTIPAISLCSDTSIITAIGNDYSFEYIFSRQVEALGNKGDILWVLSTSGESSNILQAIKKAKEKGMKIVSFTGNCENNSINNVVDYSLWVELYNTARIQELHLFFAHLICEDLENYIRKVKK